MENPDMIILLDAINNIVQLSAADDDENDFGFW